MIAGSVLPRPGGKSRSPRQPRLWWFLATLSLLTATASGCASPDPQPRAAQPAPISHPTHTAADVAFMRGMIPHHQQALEMAALVADRTSNEAIHLLAERIAVSQQDEIAQMSRWLEQRGEEAPPAGAGDHAHHTRPSHGEHGEHGGHGAHGAEGHASMPGMLTPEEMALLAAATGPQFDRLFVELMIRHHEGALMMVDELFAAPGAGQEVDAFRIASEIDSDQRIEIQRMQRMLSSLP